MLKKLRIQFICINMLLVSTVIIVAFTLLITSWAKKMEDDSYFSIEEGIKQTMPNKKNTVEEHSIFPPKDNSINRTPPFSTFYVVLDNYNEEINVYTNMHDEIDEEVVVNAVSIVLESNKLRGTIKDLNLRYVVEPSRLNTTIGFMDISYERGMLRRQLFYYILIGTITLIAFFFISMLLSYIVIRPIEKSWKQQQQFISDASHELKTPISVILANTSILLSDINDHTDYGNKWVQYIDVEAKRMKELIEDLLFLSKLDVDKNKHLTSKICLSDTIWESALPFEAVLFESNKSIETSIDSEVYIKGDIGQIKQLISILLDNACKYAVDNSTVKLSLYEKNNKAIIKVNNMSTPIPKEELQHIFNRFYRVDKARSRTKGSYGLGLSIAQKIVDAHNGKISVSSDQVNGTTFKISIPIIF